jgi:hypothetical protein
MKLQIIEICAVDELHDIKIYKYILEIDERHIVSTSINIAKKTADEAYKDLSLIFFNSCHDFNPEHYCLLGIIPELDMKVIAEQEVSDTFLKDLYVDVRMKSIDEDFN